MRWSVLFFVCCFLGCVSPQHKQSVTIHITNKQIDLSNIESKPGIAECGCTYTINW